IRRARRSRCRARATSASSRSGPCGGLWSALALESTEAPPPTTAAPRGSQSAISGIGWRRRLPMTSPTTAGSSSLDPRIGSRRRLLLAAERPPKRWLREAIVALLTLGVIAAVALAQDRCGEWSTGLFGVPGVDGTVSALVEFDDGGGPALYAGGSFATAGA